MQAREPPQARVPPSRVPMLAEPLWLRVPMLAELVPPRVAQAQSESKQAARQSQSLLEPSRLVRALVPQQVKPSHSAQAQTRAGSAARQPRSLLELSRWARAPVPQLVPRSELVEPPEPEWTEPPRSELASSRSN